jgi:hypothetical protein
MWLIPSAAPIPMRIAIAVLFSLQPSLPDTRSVDASAGTKAIAEIRQADVKRDLSEMPSPAMRGRKGGTIDELKAFLSARQLNFRR